MGEYEIGQRNRVRQGAGLAIYERDKVHAILDAGYVGHFAFVDDGRPMAIPMFYVRDGERILAHGLSTSRFMRILSEAPSVCFTVTHLDGLILARSAFHHSMNYRSVMVQGCARLLDDDEKSRVLDLFTNRIMPGRATACRKANTQEFKATNVIEIAMIDVSAKSRTGPPIDEEADLSLPWWAGVIPMAVEFGQPIADENCGADAEIGQYFESMKGAEQG